MNDGWRNGDGLDAGESTETITTTQSRSWFERIGDSLRAILIGLALFVASAFLLGWNEGRAVKTARALEEGAASVVAVPSDKLSPANEGRLIHITGMAKAQEPARDAQFNLSAEGLKLVRTVEMHQWREDKRSETVKKLGGGEETVTRYSYSREWSERAIDSSRFQDPSRHANPPMPAIGSQAYYAPEPRVGAFSVARGVVDGLGASAPAPISAETVSAAQQAFGSRTRSHQGVIYVGEPDAPRVGDLRVAWRVTSAQEVSVVGRQTASAITPYRASNGREILLSTPGVQSPDVMFQNSLDGNQMLTWLLRICGAVLMFASVRMGLSLVQVLADVIPPLGALVGAGVGFVAFAVTALVAPLVIAIAWLAYLPLLAAGLIAAGVVAIATMVRLARRREARPSIAA